MRTSEGRNGVTTTTEGESHSHLYIPPGAASWVSLYKPAAYMLTEFKVTQYSVSGPFDHPNCLLHMLPYPPHVSPSGYVCFKSKFPPEVDVRPASYKWLVEAVQEAKVRNQRDSAIFEAHALELELEPYHWEFHKRSGHSYRLIKVTILRQPGD